MSKYDTLNDMQQMAVFHTEGPLLVLAGAGSGKTRVLTHRIAYLIEEVGINPWNILAITFTNKAAGEMRDRVDKLVGFGSESIWVSTFHSTCVRILRRYIDRIGYDTNFTIYDADDQKTVVKQVMKKLDMDSKIYKERTIMNAISKAKDELITPDMYAKEVAGDFRKMKIADAYYEYQKTLKKSNALDFDDLIVKTVELFRTDAEVLEYYQNRFQYIMVDEYQDTNTAQFVLIKLLADKYRNICVVGDDDQSIYKFRGANIANILQFESAFENARTIKLEQNYRSTKTILDAANAVVHNNEGRKEKTLWCDNEEGDRIKVYQVDDANQEGRVIAETIAHDVNEGKYKYNDCACLYRTNAQSRQIEESFIMSGIPYKIIGGQNFYQRKEIKDILAYMKTVDNGMDDVAVRRIINVPRRGIGATTIEKVQTFADANGMSFYDALTNRNCIEVVGRSGAKLSAFVSMIEKFKVIGAVEGIKILADTILDETGYKAELIEENTDESNDRLDNIDELINKMADYEEHAESPSLSEFLEEVALIAEIDNLDEESDYVVLMTIHSAKGLEFPKVFLCGMEDGLFPSYMNIMSDDKDELEEERRLCYVAITRAMKELAITWTKTRMVHGETRYNIPSRFLKEIPPMLVNTVSLGTIKDKSQGNSFKFGGYEGSMNYNNGFAGSSAGAYNRYNDDRPNSYSAGSIGRKKPYSTVKKAAPTYGNPSTKPSFGKEFTVNKSTSLEYTVGDRVKHIKFGEGVVQKIVDGGRDMEVTVMFDKAGVKKMYASFAKLKKM
ncbi:MAG: DNA helicase PcrA [Lachnospiraceae bacterium]|nr:DNA helicase PcrA [Lachnospiraceae bacterium]